MLFLATDTIDEALAEQEIQPNESTIDNQPPDREEAVILPMLDPQPSTSSSEVFLIPKALPKTKISSAKGVVQ